MCICTHANGGQRTISVLSTFVEFFCLFCFLEAGSLSDLELPKVGSTD